MHFEPVAIRLAAKLAEFLRTETQGQWEEKSDVRVEFYYDDEAMGLGVRKGGDGEYNVVVEP